MSKFEDGSYGSLTGIALIGKVLAGRCKMKYTRAAVGNGAIPEGETPKTMTGPAGYIMDAKIAAVTNPIDGECQVTVQIKSDDAQTGFYATCIVLFAEDPDDGEVPYTYLSLENEPEWIRPASSIVGKLATFDLIAAVGDVDTVTAVIDPEAIATVGHVDQMFVDHNNDPNAHGGMGSAKIVEVLIPADSWVQEAEGADFTADIAVPEARDDLYPNVSVNKPDLTVAKAAGLKASVQSFAGKLRFWAEQKPTADLNATAALLFRSTGTGMMPVSDADTLGGVKVRKGSGLTIDGDGNLSLDTATAAEVEAVFSKE